MVQGLDDIPDDVSCTSTEQQWHKPRGRKIEPTAVSSMTFAKPSTTTASRKRKPVIPTYCDNRFNFILCIKKNHFSSTIKRILQSTIISDSQTIHAQMHLNSYFTLNYMYRTDEMKCYDVTMTMQQQFGGLPIGYLASSTEHTTTTQFATVPLGAPISYYVCSKYSNILA
jgi:hypothetical protein